MSSELSLPPCNKKTNPLKIDHVLLLLFPHRTLIQPPQKTAGLSIHLPLQPIPQLLNFSMVNANIQKQSASKTSMSSVLSLPPCNKKTNPLKIDHVLLLLFPHRTLIPPPKKTADLSILFPSNHSLNFLTSQW